jgi:hypothetical protein
MLQKIGITGELSKRKRNRRMRMKKRRNSHQKCSL